VWPDDDDRKSGMSTHNKDTGTVVGGTSTALLVLAALAVFALYYRFYTKSPFALEVLQTSVGGLHPDMLAEKQPIVVEDRVVNVAELVRTVFAYYYAFPLRQRTFVPPSSPFQTVRTRGILTAFSPFPARGVGSGKAMRRFRAVVSARPLYIRGTEDDERDGGRGKIKLRPCPEDPGKKEENTIHFRLRAFQVLILPPHWEVTTRSSSSSSSGAEAEAEANDSEEVAWAVVEAYDLLHACMYPVGGIRDRMLVPR
jgi:hypothetical protein